MSSIHYYGVIFSVPSPACLHSVSQALRACIQCPKPCVPAFSVPSPACLHSVSQALRACIKPCVPAFSVPSPACLHSVSQALRACIQCPKPCVPAFSVPSPACLHSVSKVNINFRGQSQYHWLFNFFPAKKSQKVHIRQIYKCNNLNRSVNGYTEKTFQIPSRP